MKNMTGGQLTQIYNIATQKGCGQDQIQFLIQSGYMADFFAGRWQDVNRTDFRKLGKIAPEDFGVKPEEPVLNTIIKIDRSIKPTYPDWVKKVIHPELEGVGPVEYDMATSELWLHDGQKNGKYIVGHKIYEHLKETDSLKNCYGHDDALAIQKNGIDAFRKVFGNKVVYCWRSVVQNLHGDWRVPCVCVYGDGLVVGWISLGHDWDDNGPAGRFAQ